ncbi:uncharacterized protein LOC132708348 [Cylas formicarius]|uniref:uncharacterized protein LOC132708348 n=1 Tax=Cylas formicarius TaxID=197179 RepID=UPI0029589900|nr:uncharacterized protein LOC132708348 [Cylas formicarius]
MENEQWQADYQQSVATNMERTAQTLNNGNSKYSAENDVLQNSCIKEDPDSKCDFMQDVINEFNSVTAVISEKGKQTIQIILAQIKTLSQNEKYFLYLKLPSEISNIVDPFRQTLNPLGTRSEIYRTIVWIQTHLEEDQNISLPKKEVYNEYEQFCEDNNIKPLSQADFGKVMKQVFPKVRARRLGQRGNSKYCYSGLRRRVSLNPPRLPDLSEKPLLAEPPFTHNSVTYAAWLIVKEWSQQQLGIQFSSLQSLAHYLIRNCSIGIGTEAANQLTSVAETHPKGEDSATKNLNKHREAQLQLQKKIQQKTEGKERKRKIQPAVKVEVKPGSKKCRSQSLGATPIDPASLGGAPGMGSSECSTASSSGSSSTSVSPTQGKTICDKSELTQFPALPDFKSFQKPVNDGANNNIGNGQDKTCTVSASPCNKTSVPKLQLMGGQNGQGQARPVRKLKYKAIQPRLQPCDIAMYNAVPKQPSQVASDHRSQEVNCVETSVKDNIKDGKCDDGNLDESDDVTDDFPLTRERLDSVSNVAKDAMDEYLGTNNSQHEEELSKYFSNSESNGVGDAENFNKLSTLRQLLEQNGISEKKTAVQGVPSDLGSNIGLQEGLGSLQNRAPMLSNRGFANPPLQIVQTPPSLAARRRVSFEDSASPNAKGKHFNFTPISPQSKCSSATASPFVSPRNTPVPRVKNTHAKKELDLRLEIPAEVNVTCLPMSAPVSPMLSNNKSLLQKLLNANNKVSYRPGYAGRRDYVPDMGIRSQSVPLHQMPSDNALITELLEEGPDFGEICSQTASDNVKQILNSLDEQTCDNNNIETFNLDLSSSNQALPEFGLHLVNGGPEGASFAQHLQLRNDMDVVEMGLDKCPPARSVPCTPSPFPSKESSSSRSYPSTPLNSTEIFVYNLNSDCLLNGQPIRTDNVEYGIASFGDNNVMPEKAGMSLESDFVIIDSGDALVDDDGILIQQGYNANI